MDLRQLLAQSLVQGAQGAAYELAAHQAQKSAPKTPQRAQQGCTPCQAAAYARQLQALYRPQRGRGGGGR